MLYRLSGVLFLATLAAWTHHLIERLKFGDWPIVSLGSLLGNYRPDLGMDPGVLSRAVGWLMEWPLALFLPVMALLLLAGGLGRHAYHMRREERRHIRLRQEMLHRRRQREDEPGD